MALIIGRIVSGIAFATLGGYLITKHNDNKKATHSKYEERSPPQPLTFTIKVPDPKENGNTLKIIGVTAIISGIIVIYWYSKDKIVLSKLLQILKTQESTKTEIKATVQSEAQGISNKIDETDCKIQQVQEEAQQINQNTNDIQYNVREMREDMNDHYYDVTHQLGRIEYQNNCLFSLAQHMDRQNRYNQPQVGWQQQQQAIAYANPNQNIPEMRRGVITQRSVSMNQSEIVLDEGFESTPRNSDGSSRWLSKFGL